MRGYPFFVGSGADEIKENLSVISRHILPGIYTSIRYPIDERLPDKKWFPALVNSIYLLIFTLTL